MTAPAPLGPKTLACLRETIPAFKELEAKTRAARAKTCEGCGAYPADWPSRFCAGCEAYQEHQA